MGAINMAIEAIIEVLIMVEMVIVSAFGIIMLCIVYELLTGKAKVIIDNDRQDENNDK